MKAKDYAKQFNDNPSMDTVLAIANGFLKECRELIEIRQAKTDSAAIAILNEQDLKWRAFARLVPQIQPSGFSALIREQMPEAYKAWKPEESGR